MTLQLPFPGSPGGWQPFEAAVRHQGYTVIAGLDEVGRGCLAGPVVAAAVVLPPGVDLPGVADSKQLSPERRASLYRLIYEAACAVTIGEASQGEIDLINILKATQLAMRRALERLTPPSDFLLIDGNVGLPVPIPQRTIVKGDSICLSIAAASIVAKVTRDRWMVDYDEKYPQYGFSRHKGYGTREHLRALEKYGPCPLHRRTFRGVLPEVPAEGASQDGKAPGASQDGKRPDGMTQKGAPPDGLPFDGLLGGPTSKRGRP